MATPSTTAARDCLRAGFSAGFVGSALSSSSVVSVSAASPTGGQTSSGSKDAVSCGPVIATELPPATVPALSGLVGIPLCHGESVEEGFANCGAKRVFT